MTLRTARRGPNAGGLFWGCDDYPECKGTRDYDVNGVAVDADAGALDPAEIDAGPVPTCPDPSCGASMRLQLARRGRNAGGYFWSCTRYPDCRETREHEGSVNGTRRDYNGHEAPPLIA